DELSLGLAPLVVLELLEILKTVRDTLGTTILLVEQNSQVALEVADYAYVIENGRIALRGRAAELARNEEVREVYLGQGKDARKSYRDVRQHRRVRRWAA
ncbi:MAG: ABC transporter ATP-binding protein, partial [Deltaproteobacteria bacterium]|nr:ABC transporter ATP-binding protein [Deltaproteobacteria bacterium]